MNIDPRELKRHGVDAEELKHLRRAFSSLPQTTSPTPDCPKVETIWAAAHRQLSGTEAENIVDHMAGCSLCAEAWRLAAGVELEGADEARDDSSVVLPWWLDWKPWMAATFAMLLVVVGMRIAGRERGPEPTMRGGAGSAIESLLQSAELPRDAFLLRWTAGPEGSLYDVSVVYVSDDALVPIPTGRSLSEATFLIPVESLVDVPAGAALDWQVSVLMPDGSRFSSATFTTVLR